MSNPKVRKAVIAAAGFGTRFLPQTKAMPKEMLPIINKPVIQYIVEQLVEAGIEDIIIVTGYHKRSIEDHFDTVSADLKENLLAGNKSELLAEIEAIPNMANFAYIRQKGLYGSTTPILNASHLLGDEPFIYTFADDLFVGKNNRYKQMIELYEEFLSPILPCITVEDDADYKRYGIVVGDEVRGGVVKASRILEKPGREAAPTNLASVGGYLLTPEVLEYARDAQADVPAGDEFYLTTYVLQKMMDEGKAIYGCALEHDNYYDTGNTLGYLKTVIDVALKDPSLSEELRRYIRSLI
ncbi:NTP transferase domain-containing protein [Candidatus Saccharibacteria bacterium]|nr:NTP transferase domain-containing protein [Candidatus Saccharibacteria bacterium]